MRKLHVVTVVGTRPEIIRLSRVMAKLDAYCDHTLIHTGQNYDYELNQIFFDDLQVRKPDYFLNSAEGSSSAAQTIGNLIREVDSLLENLEPDALLVLGDTNSCLSVIPAKRRKIPIFHMEAGNRCFDQRVPEELNRKIVDHTADINLPYSTIAREYLLREGFPPDQVIKTGSPMFEVLTHYAEKIEASDILQRLNIMEGKYFLVSAHREENIDSTRVFGQLVETLNGLADRYDYPLVVSTHPRTRAKIESSNVRLDERILIAKPFGFFDYVALQKKAAIVLSDSGTISEEASILGFNALNIREAHERPEGMEEAAVMMSGLRLERVTQCIELLYSEERSFKPVKRIVADYTIPNVSDKVVKIIHSYVDFVKRVVWHH